VKNNKKHLDEKDVKKILSDYREEVQPYFELIDAFNLMFDSFLYERILGIKKRTKIVLAPKLAFNLTAKRGLPNQIELNLGVLPLVKALAVNVSKLDFVCNEIPFDKIFDQKKVITDIADIFNVIYYQIDNYDLDDEHISELLDEYDLGTRGELSYSLFKKVLYYLLSHEFVHIRCRHASHIGRKNITEFQINAEQSTVKSNYNKRIHWAELEADHFGADLMVEMLKVFEDCSPQQPERQISNEEANELRQIFFVIGLLFLLFSYRPDEATSISFYRKCNHPHPCVRMANIMDVSANYISKVYSIDIQSIIDVMSDSLSMVIRIAQSVGIREFSVLLSNMDEIREEINDIQSSIDKTWINESNKAMIKTFISVRNGIAVV